MNTTQQPTAESSDVIVDVGGVRESRFRHRLTDLSHEVLEPTYGRVRASGDFWEFFVRDVPSTLPEGALVLADLSTVMDAYRRVGPLRWLARTRATRPSFVAFVRTERDRRWTALVDDVVRMSDMRLNVCNDASNLSVIRDCLSWAAAAQRPDTVLAVTFDVHQDVLAVQFGDGLTASFRWDQVGLADARAELVAESASVGAQGTCVELATREGGSLEIDSAALRALVDQNLRNRQADVARNVSQEVGVRIRAVRKAAGLTQAELGRRAGLDQAMVSRIERGLQRPRVDTLRRIAHGVGVSIAELLDAGLPSHA